MSRARIIDKIKKCLRLAASPNANEAAVALGQAQTLMQQHQITLSDVELSEVLSHDTKQRSGKVQCYEEMLARMVSSVFGTQHHCKLFALPTVVYRNGDFTSTLHAYVRGYRRLHHYVFVGTGSSAELAGYCFDVLLRQLSKARSEHMAKQPKACKQATRTARGDVFAEGYVRALQEKCQALQHTDAQRKLIEDWLAVNVPEMSSTTLKDRSKGRNVTTNDYHQGRAEGAKANLHAGVQGGAKQELLA